MKAFSCIAIPITKLTRKETKFHWTESCKRDFQQLQAQLTSVPILVIPERGLEYTMYWDALKEGLGCVLMQGGKVVTYGS